MTADGVEIEVGGRTVRISNPGRVYFPARGETKLDLVRYYLSVGDGIVRALRERPCMLHRFPSGVAGDKVHQKRVPGGAPPWLETVRLHFPRYGRHADELCVTELAQVIWAVQMSTVEFHPWNSRRPDVEQPDEWRIDLDPMPKCPPENVRRVAHVAHEVLDEFAGWFCGKQSPVHLFWHSFDLALARFGGGRAPVLPDTDSVNREAYSHEVIAFGFWAGDRNLREPTYYSYTAPEPTGLRDAVLHPGEAHWVEQGGGSLALLPYDVVRTAGDPRAVLLAFFESAYEAGATLAGWDRHGLDSSWCPTQPVLGELLARKP